MTQLCQEENGIGTCGEMAYRKGKCFYHRHLEEGLFDHNPQDTTHNKLKDKTESRRTLRRKGG